MEVFFESRAIHEEYCRCIESFSSDDQYDSRDTVGLHDVLRAHFLVVDFFHDKKSGIGGIGPRENNLLHSAVYRQFVSYGGKDKWTNQFEKAGTLIYGLVKDHPFHDANKRTGLLVFLYALHKMKRVPTSSQRDLEDLMVEIAEGGLNKYSRQRVLAKRSDDAEVLFIADYLKRNSRALDKRSYTITYHELNHRLQDFGHKLCNPHNNFIDVSRIERSKGILGFGKDREKIIKVAQIGFPGWKSQVGKGAIDTVRKAAKLTADKGVDSTTFFRGADALNAIISQYAAPLERLAYR